MVPTLNRDELREKMTQGAKPKAIENILRKRILKGETSAERKSKINIGKQMNSQLSAENPALKRIEN